MLSSPARRGERGSVALVVIVIFVMATLAAIMVTRNAGDLRLSVTEQHQAAADGAADLGLARAVARVQNGERSDTFDDVGEVAGAQWSATVRRTSDVEWEVTSTGSVEASRRSYAARIVQSEDRRWQLSGWHQVPAA